MLAVAAEGNDVTTLVPGQPVELTNVKPPMAKPKEEAKKAAKGSSDRLPKVGEEVLGDGSRYEFLQKLGDGAMGHVFLSRHENVSQNQEDLVFSSVAVKTEKYSLSMLPIEVKVLKVANADNCKHFCKLFDYGCVRPEFTYVVMSLLGKDLYRLRGEQPNRQFSLSTVTRLALQTLNACEELHKIGFISRDIKPSNFAPGLRENNGSKTIYMFDFGLAKRYRDKHNNVTPTRGEVGWRGTVRYGSLTAHKRMDLGRKDDIESWFYMLVEFCIGSLPWRFVTDRNATLAAKLHARKEGRVNFLFHCPKQFDAILLLVDSWDYASTPDYDALKHLIKKVRTENFLSDRTPWDWQEEASEYSEYTETASIGSSEAEALQENRELNFSSAQRQRG